VRFAIGVNLLRRGPDRPLAQVAEEALELVVTAERLGFEVAWAAEHHAIEHTIGANPLTILMHWGAHTRRIRLGIAVLVAPYWHPLRLAGEVALVDVFTGGRLEVGFGRGAFQYEFDRMAGGMPQERGGTYLREMVPAVRRLWAGDYAHEGELWRFPRATAVPKPIQRPHPPLWVAARDPDTYDFALREGLDVMATPLSKPDAEVESLAGKLAAVVARHAERPRPRFMMLRTTCVYEAADGWREPVEVAGEHLRVFDGLFFNAAGVVEGFPAPSSPEEYRARGGLSPEGVRTNLMFGTPDEVTARLRRYQALGVDVYCYGASFGLPHKLALRSLALFAEEVMPRFAEPAPAPAAPGG
jgi:alkanesulfonate monooxygenase SsuD/methylene tetrahydromethanopterin reductase-like flavin-dependent oxidoreductase (luciferase family)